MNYISKVNTGVNYKYRRFCGKLGGSEGVNL